MADQKELVETAKLLCLHRIQNETKDNKISGGGCPAIWDELMCWPASDIGVIRQPCPNYAGFDPSASASKECTRDGWWVHPSYNTTWTNFSDCRQYVDFPECCETNPLHDEWVPWIKNMSQAGYIISTIALLLACTILLSNRKLRCPRNIIHLHLFASFLLRATMALIKHHSFVGGLGFDDNYFTMKNAEDWHCKLFVTFWQYSIMANYSWILVEGIYLHNLIFMALFTDTSSILHYLILGWALPALFVIPWAISRSLYSDTYCWTTHGNTLAFLIIHVPTVASVVVNLILFLNITRVLLIKLKSSSSILLDRRISRYRKWAKSTLVLIPLFGVHYALVLGLNYSSDPVVTVVWLFCDQLFTSSQGLCVSILYCLINGEVIQVMKANWRNLRHRCWGKSESIDMWKKDCTVEDQNGIHDTTVGRF